MLAGILLSAILSPAPAVTGGAASGYVEDRVCGTSGCHQALYRSFMETDKGGSFRRPRADRADEDFAASRFFHRPSRRHYEMLWRDGRLFFRRYQQDDRGQPINVLEQQIDWIQGAGTVARVYFFRTPGGELYQVPVAWYVEDRRWGMAPGFDRPDHKGIQRRVRRECYFCHNAYPDLPAGGDAYDAPQIYPAELPSGIGCQRCHGPGAEHARSALGGGGEDEIRDSILDPGWLSTELLNDLCYQCHARRSQTSLVRFGRGGFSFRPGEPLSRFLVQLEATQAGEAAAGRLVTYPHFMMEQSRCFVESRGRMSCTTCHDSHHQLPEPQQRAQYRAVCNRCHPRDGSHPQGVAREALPAAAEGGDCVACHMPKRPTDTAHLALSDHSIPRRPDFGAVPPKRDDEVGVYRGLQVIGLDGELAELYRAAAAVQAGGGARSVETLGKILAAARPVELEPYLIFVRGLLQQRQWARAEKVLAALLVQDPSNELALEWLGIARGALGRKEEAAAAFRSVLERNQNRSESRFNLALLLLGDRRPREAIVELERAVALRPNLVAAWFYLGNAYAEQDRLAEAVERYRRALEIEPSHSDAYLAIGRTLLRRGERAEALRYWRHGARVAARPRAIAEALAAVSGGAGDPPP